MIDIANIDFEHLHKTLQFAEDWYWTEIDSVLTINADDVEITLSPDAFESEINFLHTTFVEQLDATLEIAWGNGPEAVAKREQIITIAKRQSRTEQTYWGPRIIIRGLNVTNVPDEDEQDDEPGLSIPDPTVGYPAVSIA